MKSFESVYPGVADALRPSDKRYAKVLAAGTAESLTVPTDDHGNKAIIAVFAATGDFYVNYDMTAVVPVSEIEQTAPDLNPTIRYLGGAITELSIIAPAATVVIVSFYAR